MLKPGIDLELRGPPPAPARVMRRALVLAALACRADLEAAAADPQAGELGRRIAGWLSGSGAATEAEPAEWSAIDAPPGALGRAAPCLPDPGEAAGVLAWGLKLAPLPAIDAPLDPAQVAATLGWLDPEAAEVIEAARLRARSDVVRLAEQLEVAHWRIVAAAAGEAAASLVNFSPQRLAPPADAAPLPLAASGDLAPWGRPLAAAPPAAIAALLRTVVARRRAIHWLAGQAPRYSAITVEL